MTASRSSCPKGGQVMATTRPSANAAMNGKATQQSPAYTFEELEDAPLSAKEWLGAYTATLLAAWPIMHIVASIVTVALYFLLPPSSPIWFAPVLGILSTYIILLFIALACYGLLSTRLCQLRARLDALDITE